MLFNVLVKSLGAEICSISGVADEIPEKATARILGNSVTSTKYSMRTSIPRGPAGWQIQSISEYDYYALYCKIVMTFLHDTTNWSYSCKPL